MKILDIQKAVCEEFGITMPQLLSHNRIRKFSWPRHVAMGLCREQKISFPKIAKAFKKLNHTTVMHACGHYRELLEDSAWAARIYKVEKRLGQIKKQD